MRSQLHNETLIYFAWFYQYGDIWFHFAVRACRVFQVLSELALGVWLEVCNIFTHAFCFHLTLIKEHFFHREGKKTKPNQKPYFPWETFKGRVVLVFFFLFLLG